MWKRCSKIYRRLNLFIEMPKRCKHLLFLGVFMPKDVDDAHLLRGQRYKIYI